jgi:hypothetical protein
VINGGGRAGVGVMMVVTAQRKIMGKFTIDGWLRWLGWVSTAAMESPRRWNGDLPACLNRVLRRLTA